jgi:hypothetical protein
VHDGEFRFAALRRRFETDDNFRFYVRGGICGELDSQRARSGHGDDLLDDFHVAVSFPLSIITHL